MLIIWKTEGNPDKEIQTLIQTFVFFSPTKAHLLKLWPFVALLYTHANITPIKHYRNITESITETLQKSHQISETSKTWQNLTFLQKLLTIPTTHIHNKCLWIMNTVCCEMDCITTLCTDNLCIACSELFF